MSIFKEIIENSPLAVASGISPENVRLFLRYTDCFIVATSILKTDSEYFDKDKVRKLMDMVRT